MGNIGKLRLTPRLKILLALGLLFWAFAGWRNVAVSLSSQKIYKKDFLSGYLIAKALQAGVDPYQPIPDLARRWTPAGDFTTLNHPTPHTLMMGWICYPFAWLPYEQAARIWFVFTFLCMALSLKLLLQGFSLSWSWRQNIFAGVGALAWMPVEDDFVYGQFNFVLLVLWLGLWLALRAGRETKGCAILGVMLALKLTGWPIVLWLAWQRRWRGILVAGLTATVMHSIMIALHGWPMVRDYYLKHGPLVSAFYRNQTGNLSLWTFADRLLALSGINLTILSPASAPIVIKLLSIAIPLSVLALALRAAHQSQSFDTGFAVLLSVSLLLNPVAWTHYFVMLCLPFALLVKHLHQREWPHAWTIAFCLVAGPLCIPHDYWAIFGDFLTRQFGVSQHFFLLYWGTCHILAVLGLGWLLGRVEVQPDNPVVTSAPAPYPLLPANPLST